jgi:hypothetical protein
MNDTIERMLRGYIAAALWSSCDDDNEPMDGLYSRDDIATETLNEMRADCSDFLAALDGESFTDDDREEALDDPEYLGHNFWLTRNHHGAGFWDGRYNDDLGRKLTELSHPYGSCNLYVGDDGMIYA